MLEYQRFNDDLFMLVLRPKGVPRSRMAEHADVREVAAAVTRLRISGQARHSNPTKPRHYPGVFAWETEKFRVASVYAFRGFFGLTCEPLGGGHSSESIRRLVDSINRGLPAS